MKRKLLIAGLMITVMGLVAFAIRQAPVARIPSVTMPYSDSGPGRIVGNIVGPDGKPQRERARIVLRTGRAQVVEVDSDAEGRFLIEKAPPGRYLITIRGEWAGDVEITDAQPEVKVELSAPPPAILRGRVVNKATGKPVVGAIVAPNLEKYDSSPFSYTYYPSPHEWAHVTFDEFAKLARRDKKDFVYSDAEGRFELRLFGPGREVIALPPSKHGLFPLKWLWEGAFYGEVEHDFSLESAAPYRFHGRILQPDGQPWANGTANLYVRQNKEFKESMQLIKTDAAGRYEFLPVQPPWGTFWVEAPGYAGMHQHFSIEKDHKLKGPMNWRLQPPEVAKGILEVKVLRADGKALAPDGNRVWVSRREDPEVKTGEPVIYYRWEATGYSGVRMETKDGRFERLLEPGLYEFSMCPAPLTRFRLEKNPSWFFAEPRDYLGYYVPPQGAVTKVIVEGGKTTEVTIQEPDIAALTVKVRTSQGKPVSGARLGIRSWHSGERRYSGGTDSGPITNKQGEALFDPLLPGRYVISTDSRARQAVALGKGEHRRIEIVVDPAPVVPKPDLKEDNPSPKDQPQTKSKTSHKEATLHGKVELEPGASLAGISIAALPEPRFHEPNNEPWEREEYISLATPVRRDGTFTLTGIAPGKQHLCLYRGGWLLMNSLTTIEVQEGETRKGISLRLEPPAAGLEIEFRRADGKPMPKRYEAKLSTPYGSPECGGLDEKGDIASAGKRLPPGTYQLELEMPPGAQPDFIPIRLKSTIVVKSSDKQQRIVVPVPRAGAIRGMATLPDGMTPAVNYFVVVISVAFDPAKPIDKQSILRGTYTDPDGGFEIFGFTEKRIWVVLQNPSGAPIMVSKPIDVRPGEVVPVTAWKANE